MNHLTQNLSRAFLQAGQGLVRAGQILAKMAGGKMPQLALSGMAPTPGNCQEPYPDDVAVNQAVRDFLFATARGGRCDRYLRPSGIPRGDLHR